MSHTSLILIGGGGHAAVVADAARAAGLHLMGFVDDDETHTPPGVERLGTVRDLDRVRRRALVHAAVGDATLREAWLALAPHACAPAIVHPSAVVSPSALIAEGVFVGPRAVINARAVVARGAIVNTGAIVEHDARVGVFAHVAPGAVLAGGASVGPRALVGCAACVLPAVRIGAGAVLGAASVAVHDVEPGQKAIGAPARALEAVDVARR